MSVEEQKVRYGIDRPILLLVGALIVAFIIWGVSAPESVFEISGAALTWVMVNLGWLFNVLAIGMVLLLLVIAFSQYGKIQLGLDSEKAEYGTASWAAMLFAAGIGIGIIFFGPFEPLTYYLSPRPGSPYDPSSIGAIKGAIAQSALHWGINAWAIYAVVGLSVAYISYRRGRVPLMSSIITPLWGSSRSDSIPARLIDALAIIATLFGTAASLGIGALQIARGVEIVSGLGESGNTVALLIITVLTAGTIASSRGRTILQFVLGVLLIPSSIIVLAFAILGGTTIWLQRRAMETGNPEAAIAPDGTTESMPLAPEIFFSVVDQLPGGGIVATLVIAILAIFFITTADSASLVNSQMSQRGNPEPNRLVTAFWVVCMSGIAVVILLFGGQNALQGLQNLIVVTALPFAVILVLMAVGLVSQLRHDPMAIRDHYEQIAIAKAVKRGVREYGDHFALTVEPTPTDSDLATGADFDSAAPEVTEWYARTDEHGTPVEYDYCTGEYVGAGPDDARSGPDRPAADREH